MKVFNTRISWLFLKGFWVTANLLKSSGLFLVFWQILIMLSFGWSPLVLLFPSPQVPSRILCWLYRAYQLQLVSPSLSCSTVFLVLYHKSRQTFWYEGRITGLWIIKGPNLLKSKEYYKIRYVYMLVLLFFFQRLPRAAQNSAAGRSLPTQAQARSWYYLSFHLLSVLPCGSWHIRSVSVIPRIWGLIIIITCG